jgi:adenosylcobinamide-phosphate guanylyltransferase
VSLTALIMAGGRATRMGTKVEKPLLEVSGKPMLQLVIEVLKRTKVDRIVVASSPNTPSTSIEARRMGVEVLVTPGDGFEEDTRFAIRRLSLGDVLVVSADLPFITADIVERAVQKYRSSGKPALAVMAKPEVYGEIGSKPQYLFKVDGQDFVPVGINLINGRRIDEGELDQTIFVIDSGDVVLNVNTSRELDLARKRFSDKSGTNSAR